MARLSASRPAAAVVTCEHASRALPRGVHLGVSERVLRSHVAWDPGAFELASALARRLGSPVHRGRYSRLWIDLNRSAHHPKLIPAVAFGVPVPGNRGLGPHERRRRIARYWAPYRSRVEAAVARAIERAGRCAHFSVHTFTPNLDGRARRADVGLLYDPSRRWERAMALALRRRLREAGLTVRMNYPYRGTADGLTTSCRKTFAARRYGDDIARSRQSDA